MLQLELDWAGDSLPQLDRMDEGVLVELVSEKGPTGHPVIRVYVEQPEFAMAHVAYQKLDGWLRDVYGADEAEAMDLADLAV